jgi:hypothetical protein
MVAGTQFFRYATITGEKHKKIWITLARKNQQYSKEYFPKTYKFIIIQLKPNLREERYEWEAAVSGSCRAATYLPERISQRLFQRTEPPEKRTRARSGWALSASWRPDHRSRSMLSRETINWRTSAGPLLTCLSGAFSVSAELEESLKSKCFV